MKTYSILMLGAKGVGKTTLLTLVCEELKKELEKFGISAEMDPKTQDIFNDKKEKIFSMLKGTFDITNHLEGTDSYESYSLDIKDAREQQFITRIHFQDCPGGDLAEVPDDKSKLIKYFVQADTIIYVVDTPYLMENGAEYNEVVNHMENVRRIFSDHMSKLNFRNLLVIPLKCERYEADKVKRTVELLFEKLNEEISSTGRQVEILPVHTVGTILFDRFLYDGGIRPNAKYIRKYPNSKFQPLNIDLLTRKLLYAMPTKAERKGFLSGLLKRKDDAMIRDLKEKIKGMI